MTIWFFVVSALSAYFALGLFALRASFSDDAVPVWPTSVRGWAVSATAFTIIWAFWPVFVIAVAD